MKKTISFLMVAIFTIISIVQSSEIAFSETKKTPVFNDIKGHWAEETITRHYEKNMLKGYPNGAFKPDQQMTRAELVTLLNRYFGLTNGAPDNYQDVPSNEWYAQETAKARYYGYIQSLKAEPDIRATREAVVQMLSLIIDVEEQKRAKPATEFKDLDGLSQENRKNILDFSEMGYIKGYPDNKFNPNNTINRAEIMTLAESVLGYIVTNQADLDNIPADAKKITIIKPNLKIENKTINADIFISPGVNGSVTIKNSTVNGKIEISGGTTEKPIVLDHVKVDKVIVTKVKEKTVVQIISSEIKELKIKSETTVKTDEKTIIDIVKLNSNAKIEGKGEIKTAYVSSKDVVIEKRPNYVEITEKNIVLKISDKDMIQENDDKHKTTSTSSSHSSSHNSKIKVEGTTISGDKLVGSMIISEITPTVATAVYQWQREQSKDVFADIDGAKSNTYILKETDIDKKIRLIATGIDNYTGTVTSNIIGPVETNDIIAQKIKQGFIPIANKNELNQIQISASNTFGAGTKYENTYTGGLDKKYIQVSNIDLSGENFVPIGYDLDNNVISSFVGIYNGNGYLISNLKIDRNKESQGLFSKLGKGAFITDVAIKNANLKTFSKTGALAGEADGAIVEKSKVINASLDFYEEENNIDSIGGFIGKCINTRLQSLELDGLKMTAENMTWNNMQLRQQIGGIAGFLNGGEIKNIYAKNININAVKNANEGKFFNMGFCGGLVGEIENQGTQATVVDSCYAKDVNLAVGSQDICIGGLIGRVGNGTIATSDITIKNSSVNGEIRGKMQDSPGPRSIGGFVSSVNIKTPLGHVLVENCKASVDIRDLGINFSSTDIAMTSGYGGFAARLMNTKLINCHATGTLDSELLGGAGGFAGYIDNSTLEKCYTKGSVKGWMWVGGFASYISKSNLTQCYATGDVEPSTGNNDGDNLFLCGGFACRIDEESNVSDSYYSGNIGSPSSSNIAGFAYSINSAKNVYTSGVVCGSSDVYTFASSGNKNIIGAFWNQTANPTGIAVGSGTGDIKGITDSQFKQKATFINWNISDTNEGMDTIWRVEENKTLPYLIECN